MKTILPWLLVLLVGGGAGFFYKANQTKTAELALVQGQLQELETLRAENEELKKSQIAPEELARLKESQDELLRLRNEVRQLRTDKTQLNQQAQAAKSAAAQAQAQAVAAQTQAEEVAKTALAEKQKAILEARLPAANFPPAERCINTLRQLAAAKAQWAVESQKPANATPTEEELAVYFPGQAIPRCSGGGTYTFGNLSAVPTCTVAGHVWPTPQ